MREEASCLPSIEKVVAGAVADDNAIGDEAGGARLQLAQVVLLRQAVELVLDHLGNLLARRHLVRLAHEAAPVASRADAACKKRGKMHLAKTENSELAYFPPWSAGSG